METMRTRLEKEIGAECGTTKFMEHGGNLVTKGLSGAVTSTGPQGCSIPKKCIVDPEQRVYMRWSV